MTITPERREFVAFSRPYLTVEQTVVTRADEAPETLRGPRDLDGRRVIVRETSAYYATLKDLRDRLGIGLVLEAAAESVETEELIRGVGTGPTISPSRTATSWPSS